MARVTVEDCVDKVPNRFDLVLLAAHRAREIAAGSPLTIDRDNDKNPVVALREIAARKIDNALIDEVEKAERERAEPVRIGYRFDVRDSSIRDRDAQHQQEPPVGRDHCADRAVDQCRPGCLSASLIVFRDRGRAADFGRSAHPRRGEIGAVHDVRIEHLQQPFEVAAA